MITNDKFDIIVIYEVDGIKLTMEVIMNFARQYVVNVNVGAVSNSQHF